MSGSPNKLVFAGIRVEMFPAMEEQRRDALELFETTGRSPRFLKLVHFFYEFIQARPTGAPNGTRKADLAGVFNFFRYTSNAAPRKDRMVILESGHEGLIVLRNNTDGILEIVLYGDAMHRYDELLAIHDMTE